jgi:SAM-dependent methyltransferase
MDELARYNQARWDELAQANVEYSRPLLELNLLGARAFLDPYGNMGDVRGRRVLCLASGGGQQSVAFALLGAEVTVVDLSPEQLARDRLAAEHHGLAIHTVHGDMRDLSPFKTASFDLVYHAYSINFVPAVEPVFREVARVLRPRGLYRIQWANPFTQTIDETSWNGVGYLLQHPYREGTELSTLNPTWDGWDVTDEQGVVRRVASPKEFVHTFSVVINSLIAQGFVLRHLSEGPNPESDPEPGSWQHFITVAPPWITLWAEYRPDAFAK